MQGKACFNFKTIDPALLEELAALTQKGYERLVQRNQI
jgi:pyruvate dehydrogenase complex dehydrogenase (E1) component